MRGARQRRFTLPLPLPLSHHAHPIPSRHLQDLNVDPKLPFPDESFDVVTCVVSVDYLNKPLEVFKEVRYIYPQQTPNSRIFTNTYTNTNKRNHTDRARAPAGRDLHTIHLEPLLPYQGH